MKKRGSTEVIAIVLLLLISIALVATAFVWFRSLQNKVQNSVEEKANDAIAKTGIDISIFNTNYNNGNLEIWFKNNGATTIEFDSESLINVRTGMNEEVCTNKLYSFTNEKLTLSPGASGKLNLAMFACTNEPGSYIILFGLKDTTVSGTFSIA